MGGATASVDAVTEEGRVATLSVVSPDSVSSLKHMHKHSCALHQIRCAYTQVWHEVRAVQRFGPEAMGLPQTPSRVQFPARPTRCAH